MQAVQDLTPAVPTAPLCEALGVPRATVYRRRTLSANMGETLAPLEISVGE